MPEELNIQDVQNILNIMSRTDIKGNEAHAYVTAEMKLKMIMQRLQNDDAPATEDGDEVSGD